MIILPDVPIDTEYELSLGEQKIADRLAKARYRNARRNGVRDQKMGDQSCEQTDQNGMGAEIAFCHLFCTRPDLSVTLRSATKGTDEGDTFFKDLGNLPVDVKHTDWSNGRLLAMLTKKSGDYLFALLNGCYPFFRFKGFAWAKQVVLEENIKNLGHGRGYVFRGRLLTLKEALHNEEYNEPVRQYLSQIEWKPL